MFPGSHDMLVRENEELDRLQLPRIADEYELTRYELAQELVPVSESDGLKFAPDLPENRHYCRPWTREFLQDFSTAYYDQFHSNILITSMVRTVEQQHQLAPLEPLRGTGIWRYRFHSSDRRHLRHVAPQPDLRAV